MSEFQVKVYRILWFDRNKDESLLYREKVAKKCHVIKHSLRTKQTTSFPHGPHGEDKGYFKMPQSLCDFRSTTCS